MDLRTDRRGQAVQVGAVLLLGVAIVMFSTYQATIVPNENAQAEFQHNQNVHSQMEDIRNAIVSPPEKGHLESVKVDLGTSYPSRTIGTNPGDPSGTLRTNGTTADNVDIGFRNAKPITGTPSYWAGDMDFNSGALLYEPNYNEHKAPETVYEHTALYNDDFRAGRTTLKDPSLIDGNDINIVALTGELLKSGSGTASFDVTTVDKSTETLELTDSKSGNLELMFHSRQPSSYWERLEDDETEQYIQDISSSEANGGWNEVTIELTPNERYDVTLTNVSVDTNPPDPTEDGTKMSMVAHDTENGTGSEFEDWSLNAKPTSDCEDESGESYYYSKYVNPDVEPASFVPFIGGVCRLGGTVEADNPPESLLETYTERSYFLPEGKYQVGYTYYAFTTWDDEKGEVQWRVDGSVEASYSEQYQDSNDWNNDNTDGSYVPYYERHPETFTVNHPGGEATLRVTSNLDDSAKNEAFGVNDVWIRHMDDG